MRWSRFPLGITCPDKIEQVESATMDAFASTVRTLAPTEAWSAACFDPPHRAARNVTHVGALVLDVDGKHNHNGTMEQARVALTGLPYVLHTTKSHTLTAPSFRVVIAISRAVSAKEFASLWRVGAQRLGAHGVRIDEATKDASRAWYAPPDAAEFVIADGSPLDVEEALRTATAQGRQARDPFTRAVARIASARPGERNKELFCAGVATRRLIEHGHIQADDAVAQLTAAAEQVGLERAEIDATIARALTRSAAGACFPTHCRRCSAR